MPKRFKKTSVATANVPTTSVLFWITVSLGLIYSLTLHWALLRTIHSPFFQPDSGLYSTPALNLLFDGTMNLVPNRTEGYPLFLFLVLKLSGSFFGVLIAQHLNLFLTGLAASLIYYFVFQKTAWTSFFVGWAVSLSGEAMSYAHTIMTENLFGLLLVLSLLSLYLSIKQENPALTILTAILVTLTVLVRPVGLGILAAIGLSYLLCLKIKKWHLAGIYGASVLILISSWCAYNQKTKGFFGLTSHSGDILFDSTAFLLDIDDSLPPDIRQQLSPVYDKHRSRMVNDWEFVSYDPEGPVQALLKLEDRKPSIDLLLRSLAIKTIRNHPVRYSLFLFNDLVEYHLRCFDRPNYFVFPSEYIAWLGSVRFYFATQSQAKGLDLFGYSTPFPFLAANPEVAKVRADWAGLFPAFEKYRTQVQDPYLDNMNSVALYPFSISSIFTFWLSPLVNWGQAIAMIGVGGGIFLLLFSAPDRSKVAPILLVSFFHLMTSSLQGVEPRFALPVQPLYLILCMFTLERAADWLKNKSGFHPR